MPPHTEYAANLVASSSAAQTRSRGRQMRPINPRATHNVTVDGPEGD